MSAWIANRYELLDTIGQGGMGVVHRAKDRLTGSTIALKRVMVPHDRLQFASMGDYEDLRLALAQEFKVLASLRHPGIVSVLDYGFDTDLNPFFTMEYLHQAQTIFQYGQNVPVMDRVQLLIQVLQALVYLHRHNILHRDLKPANILVTNTGQATLLDFGLSTSFDQAAGGGGTLMYIAPEVLRQESATRTSDLYGLGMVAYELLAGRYPFDVTDSTRLITDILLTLPDLTRIENQRLQLIMMRWLSKDPDVRYSRADEIIPLLYDAIDLPPQQETAAIRESFLQSAEFVGRETELQQLNAALSESRQKHGSAWLIGGESGVGKSRLLEEFRTLALVEGATVIRGQSVEGGGMPYELWRDIMRRLALTLDITDLEASILAELVPDIATILNREALPAAPGLMAAMAQERLVQTMIDLLKRQQGLTVLLLEDLHWSSVESLALLKKLVATIQEFPVPLMLVGSYRHDERLTLPQELPGMTSLTLQRFDTGLIEALSVSILGETGRRSELLELLHKETEGNVFFMVEVVRALVEDAGQLNEVGVITLPQHITTGGMAQIIRRRVNRIPIHAHALLKLAAVMGRRLDLKLLHESEVPEVVNAWLMICMEAAILEIQENHWQFAHDKLRETVLHDLSDTERQVFHRQAAEAIESVYPDDPGYSAILSDHWHQAQDTGKAAHYASLACEKAVSITAYQEALLMGERALTGLPQDSPIRVRVMRWMGDACFGSGDRNRAETLYQTAIDTADKMGDRTGKAEALYGMSSVTASRGDFEAWRNVVEQAYEISEDKKNRAYGLMILSSISRMKADYEHGREYLEKSLILFREINDLFGIAAVLNDVGIFDNQQGRFGDARVNLLECLDLMRRIGNQKTIALALSNLGIIDTNQGKYDAAQQYLQEGVAILRKTSDRNALPTVLNRMASVLAHRGDFAGAQSAYDECTTLCRELKLHTILPQALVGLGSLAAIRQDFDHAREYFDEAIDIGKNVGAWMHSAALLAQGNSLNLKGEYHAARDCYEASLKLLENLEEPWRRAAVRTKLGAVLVMSGEAEAGQEMLKGVLAETWTMGATPLVLDSLYGLARCYVTMGNVMIGVKFASLVAGHPALSAIDTEPWLGQLFEAGRQQLTAEVYGLAVAQGEAWSISDAAGTLLDVSNDR